jgi:hypothetical protein
VLVALAASSALAGEPHLPVGDPAYARLERLAARGLISDGLLGTRPLARDAVKALIREARARAGIDPDPWTDSDLSGVEDRLVSLGSWRDSVAELRYTLGEGPPVPTGLERHGDRFESGGTGRIGVDVGGSLGSRLAWGYHPEVRYPVGSANDLDLAVRSAYVALKAWGLELTVGREALWWGPGFRGSLLLTDNSRPFDLVRLETVQPWRVRWIGPVSAHLFMTRLEADRLAIPNPYLAGVRLAFRPHPLLEFGLARTAMFGGEGRPVTANLIWDVVRARGENDVSNPGNQLAASDVVVRIPWRVQPVTLYAEVGGEDEAGGVPSHPALVAGVYLPTIFGAPQWEVRAEAADNALADVPGVWYQHGVYQSGYTYRGLVIGHPMGTDARMLSLEIAYRPTPATRVALLYDTIQRRVFEPAEFSARSVGTRVGYERGRYAGSAEYRYARVEDPARIAATGAHVVDVSYRATW